MMRFWRLDLRHWLMCLALVLALATFFVPRLQLPVDVYDVLAVFDVTGSMNVADYGDNNERMTRLEAAKVGLTQLLKELPCSSRVGVGLFTQRRTFLLTAPMEVCSNYAALKGTIGEIDWRMAWDGDSYVTKGIHHAIGQAEGLDANVLFFTDGQEAPPLHHTGIPPFEGEPGKVMGVIVGVGQPTKSPIPKFDQDGRQVGFYDVDDVPHENRHGLPPAEHMTREGFHPRNAPWGGEAPTGDEHLSSVREQHLKNVAAQTALTYVHLRTANDSRVMLNALRSSARARRVTVSTDVRGYFAAASLACLVAVFVLLPLIDWLRPRSKSGGANALNISV